MKHQLIIAGMLLLGAPSLFAQSYFDDDIYYNPNKDKTEKAAQKAAKKKSNYIANMADMDVDTYNRRNQYYATLIDTIGASMENGEDFVYTQQIQKYYNPTIVVDNADVLADVLANSYGNVDIEINDNGLPVFLPSYSYSWPYYNRWGFSSGPWGWGVSFYDPWYSWNWGPSWAWNTSWSWGPSWSWGSSWGWGPSWGPAWGPSWNHPPMADWRPNGNRPVNPRPGWSSGRPIGGGNIANNHHRPIGGGVRPGSSTSRPGWMSRPGSTTRPGSNNLRPNNSGVVNNNGKWEYVNNRGQRNQRTGRTVVGGGTVNNQSRPGGVTNSGNRGSRTDSYNKTTTNRRDNSGWSNSDRNNNSNRNYNTNRSYNRGNNGSFRTGGGGSRGTVGGGGSRGSRGGRR